MELEKVLAGVRGGQRRAVGRAISLVERLEDDGRRLIAELHPETGRALRIGITGSPGVGKSTLISALVRHLRGLDLRVAVVSVDPTSPFTHGAVLGDRIRLNDHFLDAGVFIRSMASRGHLGGLAEATADAVLVLDAAGYDVVLVETVGSGQNEVEVHALTETVVLVLMPGSGDSIQALKAGLMEIAEVIVLNKADHPGADAMEAALRASLAFRPEGYRPPIVRTVATGGKGLDALHQALLEHRQVVSEPATAGARRREKMRARIRHAVREGLLESWVKRQGLETHLETAADEVIAGRTSPYRAARDLIERMTRHGERSNANAS